MYISHSNYISVIVPLIEEEEENIFLIMDTSMYLVIYLRINYRCLWVLPLGMKITEWVTLSPTRTRQVFTLCFTANLQFFTLLQQNNLSNPPTPPASLPPTPPPVACQKLVNGFATTEELAGKAGMLGGHDGKINTYCFHNKWVKFVANCKIENWGAFRSFSIKTTQLTPFQTVIAII